MPAELLDELAPPLELERVWSGELTPVFFGSAMTNFGVQLFLDAFMRLGAPPGKRSVEAVGAEKDFTTGEIDADAEVAAIA